MKKITLLLLLLVTTISFGQTTLANKLKITGNVTSTTYTKINVQEADGIVNTIDKTELTDVIAVASIVNLPVTGVLSKIYITSDTNKIYRWTGTVYQELAVTDITGKVDKNAPITGGTNTKITYDSKGLVTSGTNLIASDIPNIAESQVTNLVSDLALKAPLASPTFTGTVSGITKSMVGLGNVDNTSDINKPVSTAQQIAIDAKVGDFINDGATTIAPSMNAVYDALAIKKEATSTAITSTFTITNNTTTFSVSSFTGVIVNNSTVPATRTNITFAGASNVTPLYQRTLLYVDNTGTLRQQNGATGDLTPLQKRDNIFVGLVVYFSGVVVAIQQTPSVSYDTDGRLETFFESVGVVNRDGNVIAANGANLKLNKGSGRTQRSMSNYAIDKKVPDVTNDAAIIPIPAGVNVIGYRNGLGGWTYEPFTNGDITPTFWDNGTGTKATVANNKYTNQQVYFFNGTDTFIVYLGQAEYGTLEAAKQAAETASGVLVDPATSPASLRTTISVEKNCAALNNTSLAHFTPGPKISGGNSSGSGVGAQNLQSVYNNSVTPQITTSTALGAVTIKRGSAADTDNVLVVQNGAGSNTFSVTGAGVLNASNKQNSLATDGTGVKFPTVDAVNSEKPIKTVVYEGDSMTDTSVAGYPTNYPNQISDYNFDFSRAGQVNVAQAGDQIQAFIAGGQYASQVQPYKPTNNKERVLFCLMMGTNDFAVGRTPAQVYADLKTVWAQAKADGFTVIALTVTRSTNSTRDAGAVAVAKLIASDPTLYDYIVRTDLILPNPSDTFYFNGDGIHLTKEGSIKIAQELNRVVSSQINGYDYLETSLPIINGNVSIGKSKAVKFSKLDIKGFAAPAMPANSGINQSSGIISRFGDSDNLVLDLGGASASGAWLQSTDALNLSTNYPLLLNPNGGDVKIKSAVVESNNKDALIVSDTRTQATGVGGSILFKGVYTNGGTPLDFARISLMKENSVNADYSFGLGFYTSGNGGSNPSATPNFYIAGNGSAYSLGNFESKGNGGFLLTNGSSWNIYSTANDFRISQTGVADRLIIDKITGNLSATSKTLPVGTNTTQIATTAFVQAATRPYKVYTALITQTGTNAPTATVLENTLGGTVVWTRTTQGKYNGTLSGVFTSNKVAVFHGNTTSDTVVNGFSTTTDTVTLETYITTTGAASDGELSSTPVEIRVYN